ncbi:MAG TPA: glycosyltransferase [Acidimicrobiales bacterium]|nr:glycosyltransferase [Acidimicrobiales bacterium]
MRVLCTCLPEFGHFHPLVPVAQALENAGHTVAFATAGEFCERIERAGFDAFPAGLSFHQQMDEARRCYPQEAALPPGPDRFASFVPRMLAGVAAPARAKDLLAIVSGFRPDVVLHGEAEFGGPLVAELAGLPYVGQSLSVLRPLEMARLAGDTLARACRDRGWNIDVGPFGGLYRYLYLDVCPPGLQSAEISAVAVAHRADAEGKPLAQRSASSGDTRKSRDHPYDGTEGEAPPAWVKELDDRPTIYVTLGTINDDPALYRVILDGLRDEPVNVVVTVGGTGDPASLDPGLPNVYVERYIPQSLLLPHCSIVVNHAGSILPPLGHALPMLMVPGKGNEFHNAEACMRAGIGRVVARQEATAETVRREVRILLEDESYRNLSRNVASEIAAMPGAEHAARLVERLAEDGRPAAGDPAVTGSPTS